MSSLTAFRSLRLTSRLSASALATRRSADTVLSLRRPNLLPPLSLTGATRSASSPHSSSPSRALLTPPPFPPLCLHPSATARLAHDEAPTGPREQSATQSTTAHSESLCPPSSRSAPLRAFPLPLLCSVPVTFVATTGERWSISAEVGDTLLQTANKHDIPLVASCGGGGISRDQYGEGPMCRTCHVYLDNAHVHRAMPHTDDETRIMAWIDNKTKKSHVEERRHSHLHPATPSLLTARAAAVLRPASSFPCSSRLACEVVVTPELSGATGRMAPRLLPSSAASPSPPVAHLALVCVCWCGSGHAGGAADARDRDVRRSRTECGFSVGDESWAAGVQCGRIYSVVYPRFCGERRPDSERRGRTCNLSHQRLRWEDETVGHAGGKGSGSAEEWLAHVR